MRKTKNYNKYKEILGFEPSDYQLEIFDFVEYGTGNAVISAYAGCAKTTSIVAAMKLIPPSKKCLFLAFNNNIADSLNERIIDYKNCKAMTIHKLGLLMCYKNLGDNIVIDEYKYRTYLKNNINDLTSLKDGELKNKKDFNQYIDNISELIDFSRVNLAQSVKEIGKIADRYGIAPLYDEIRVAKKCLTWGKNNTKTIDYTDMVWLPNELSFNPQPYRYDWILADEVQDFSIAYIELIKKCYKRGTRTIMVGDKNQCINQFSGASEEAFDYLCNQRNTRVLKLPVSYRCPKKVVELAREFVPDFEWAENAIDGTIVDVAHVGELRAGDLVICRSRAPLFQLYEKLLSRNIKSYMVGAENEYERMLKIINSTESSVLVPNLKSKGVFSELYEKLFHLRNKIMESNGLDLEDATLSNQVMQYFDTINNLLVLSKGLSTKERLIKRMQKVFEASDDAIKLSTIHKAKGQEADNVYILCFSSMPSSLAKKDWEIIQEENLIYVALTRAKKKLGFISEKEITPYGTLLAKNIILAEVGAAESLVCALNGTEPLQQTDTPQIAKFKLKGSTDLSEAKKLKNSVKLGGDSKRKSGGLKDLISK